MNLRPRGYVGGADSPVDNYGGSPSARSPVDNYGGSPSAREIKEHQKSAGLLFRSILGRRTHPGVAVVVLVLVVMSFFLLYSAAPSAPSGNVQVGRLRGATKVDVAKADVASTGLDLRGSASADMGRSPEITAIQEDTPAPVLQHRHHAQETDTALAVASGSAETALVLPSHSKPESSQKVRGAAVDVQHRYSEQRRLGHFDCFDGSQRFAQFNVVNDDFCDCADGSDEPGTSACAGIAKSQLSGFHCDWALNVQPNLENHGRHAIVRQGVVNDGICDCCGGEDEWDHEGGAPVCADSCAALEAADQAEASIREAGAKVRDQYVHDAIRLRDLDTYEDLDGGPDDVFLAVKSKGCVKLLDGDYTYEVCIFDKVTQRARGGHSFTLGRGGEWSTMLWENGEHRKDYSKLIMGGGEFCGAANAPRRAEIEFECAAKPSIVSVQEAQVCVYSVHMRTPAACHKRS